MHRAHDRRAGSGTIGVLGCAAACAVVLAVLGGCRSDRTADGGPSAGRRQPTASRPQGTTDRGSRLVDFTAPLGGLTVETPPVQSRHLEP